MTNSMIKVKCSGTIIGCGKCTNLYRPEGGYCKYCGRPLNRKIGDRCGTTFAYVERGYIWKGCIRVKCKFCKTVNII